MSGGYKKYLLNIIPRLAANSNVESLLCVSAESLNVDKWFKPMPNVEFADYAPFRFFSYRFTRNLRGKLKQFSPDLIFIPVARRFAFTGIPVVTMIQNVFPFLWQEVEHMPLSEKVRLNIQYFEAIKSLKKVNRIIVNSNFVKDLLIRKFNVSPEKISVIYFGKDSRNTNIKEPANLPSGLEKGFLFSSGSIEPYRGLEDIIEAARYLNNDFPELKVVIAGRVRTSIRGYYRKLLRLCRLYDLTFNIVWLGHLTQDELAWYYANCSAFIMTSRMESFGMIGLEAMANGCVCISADNPCLPELFGDGAVYYPPKDGKALADVIKSILAGGDNQREVLSENARERAARFSWDICAEKTMAVLAESVNI